MLNPLPMKTRFALLALLVASPLGACQAGPPPAAPTATVAAADTSADVIFNRLMRFAQRENLHTRPIGEVMQALGEKLRGTPYVAGILDAPDEETLVAPLDKFDCVLFVESMFALARGVVEEDYSYSGFLDRIEEARYRGGQMDGYCSRLHYFSDWIRDNEARGLVENVTREIGGETLDKRLDFMSTHRSSYPRLAASDSLFGGIVAMEKDLAGYTLYYVPQHRIREVYPLLQAGDIIAATTSVRGLDAAHTGLVYRAENGRVGFMHASTTDGVKVSPDLQSYIEGVRAQTGIIVARPRSPHQG